MSRLLSRLALAVVLVWIAAGRAHADDAVALLPLDTDQKLEIYGQPVANEIARALTAGSIDVVVVKQKMAVPERARLIVDGTIASGKGTTVVLTMRIRKTADGTVLATMNATAPTLANIDKAAADLAARMLPSVRELLVSQRVPPGDVVVTPPADVTPPNDGKPARRPLLLVVKATNASGDRMRPALNEAVAAWAHLHGREPTKVAVESLSAKLAPKTVKASGNDLGISFEILSFEIVDDDESIPLAYAKVRVRISDAVGIVFERVIRTDSVVGDRTITVATLAERTAREVVDILRPHVKRTVAGWR